ncbi:hypothetical protein [Chitiniphilus eburneus]|uniref:Uncharacterized protein n=1 Tax=Chitiniphilus eburneus TaxID=2571148 RepID=A0A4U0QI23_9NEIS|nr:hypothetical protein [Chitiniphilus eburneus]TJZ75614.1 hypothetical protein FAZ21_06785 [Chitiniphilus eburneus]
MGNDHIGSAYAVPLHVDPDDDWQTDRERELLERNHELAQRNFERDERVINTLTAAMDRDDWTLVKAAKILLECGDA